MDVLLAKVATYVSCLVEASLRFAKCQKSFDFFDPKVNELMFYRCFPFIEDIKISYKEAHEKFLVGLENSGWRYGPEEDLDNKLSPDMVPYDRLSDSARKRIAFQAGMISSAIEFFRELQVDIEANLMDNLTSSLVREKPDYKA